MMKNDYEYVKIVREVANKQKTQLVKLKESKPPEFYISLHLMDINISDQDLTKLRKLKYLNIIQPQNYYEEGQERILIFPECFDLKLTYEQLAQNYYRILLQLALMYAEFEKRQVNWPLNELQQLYYSRGILYISLLDLDYVKPIPYQSPFQIFKKFTLQHFSQYIPEIQNLFQQNQFKPIIDFLLKQNGNLDKINYMNPPYENVLLFLLSQENQIKLLPIYEMGNSVVKGFNTPESLKITYTRLGDQIVYKSTRFQSEEFKEQIQSNIQREIELMEQAFDSPYAVTCFAYIRIFEFSFLLQNKFVRTLADFLIKWCKQNREERQTIKDVLVIANRFALALKSLKSFNILHRDLKPENLFLDHEEIHKSYIYIADFDRSKQVQGQGGDAMTTQNVQNTPKYDPPETTQSFYYDIYQFGLIILTIMNLGKYIGNEFQGSRFLSEEDHNKYYSKQAIKNTLRTQYPEQFVDIIAQCLKRDPKQRPDIQQIYSIINPLYLDTKIQKVRQTLPSNESSVQQNQQQVRFQSNPSTNAPFQPIQPTQNQDIYIHQNNFDGRNTQMNYQEPQQYQQYPQFQPQQQQQPQQFINQQYPIYQSQAPPQQQPIYQSQAPPQQQPNYQQQATPQQQPIYQQQAPPQQQPIYQQYSSPQQQQVNNQNDQQYLEFITQDGRCIRYSNSDSPTQVPQFYSNPKIKIISMNHPSPQ